ncbi:MAG: glutamate--cysteine ligase [Candidatus Binatota bacterium]|nr:glutamate--cysteine ligase [Candidatus Binatota bacterium]
MLDAVSDLVQTDAALDVPVGGLDSLVAYFESGAKPKADWKVGTEYEKVAVEARTGRAAPYFGPNGIERLLERIADRFGWQPRREGEHVIALEGARGATITLEPGAQVELSGEQCPNIHCAHEELSEHVAQVVTTGEELGILFLGLGIQPVSRVEEIQWVPKERYRIMAAYMAKVGRLGHRMMKQTATVQANLDFADERDAMEKMRVAMGLAPVLTAAFANSPICDGRQTGYMSYRQHIWTDTDPNRSGLLRFVFSREAGFEDYARWALDVPMYFIRREGRFIDLTGMPFREFARRGAAGHHATMADWQLHLTTLFPEVRLKTYLEVRSADSQPPSRMLALPALLKGVLYDRDCLGAAWDLVKSWSWSERLEIFADSHKEALRARVRGIPLLDFARELLAIATTGLVRQEQRNSRGEDETVYLVGLQQQLDSGRSPARTLAELWERDWKEEVGRLVEFARYRIA